MITHSEGHVMGEAVYAETELDCFHLFMTPQILKHIVDMTNRKIQNKIDNKWQYRLWGPAQEFKIKLHIETY